MKCVAGKFLSKVTNLCYCKRFYISKIPIQVRPENSDDYFCKIKLTDLWEILATLAQDSLTQQNPEHIGVTFVQTQDTADVKS